MKRQSGNQKKGCVDQHFGDNYTLKNKAFSRQWLYPCVFHSSRSSLLPCSIMGENSEAWRFETFYSTLPLLHNITHIEKLKEIKKHTNCVTIQKRLTFQCSMREMYIKLEPKFKNLNTKNISVNFVVSCTAVIMANLRSSEISIDF